MTNTDHGNLVLPSWLKKQKFEVIEPRKKAIQNHPFLLGMAAGSVEHREAEAFFSGLMWHLMAFGSHVTHLKKKRPAEINSFLQGRSEDKDGDTGVLKRIVVALGGPADSIEKAPWFYRPHPVWITHDALLRSAIYSQDISWLEGAAALNVGIESLVPIMIEPLFRAASKNFGLTSSQTEWLESRSGEAEKQHGENGYLLLAKYVDHENRELQEKCAFQIDALSYSMAFRLLESGLTKKL